jgi:hypothetical protein
MSQARLGEFDTTSDERTVVDEREDEDTLLDPHTEVERTYPSGNYVRAKVETTPKSNSLDAYQLRVLEGDEASKGDMITSHREATHDEWEVVA